MQRALIIEDEFDVRQLIVRALKAEGFEIEETDNGLDGYDLFKTSQFDIILMDIYMPVMNGVDLARKIRYEGSQIPIIFVSALLPKGDELDEIKKLSSHLIEKPFKPSELIERINKSI